MKYAMSELLLEKANYSYKDSNRQAVNKVSGRSMRALDPDSKMVATSVRVGNKKPEYCLLWFLLSSGERIRTTDLRVMRVEPEIVTFVLRSRPFYEHCVRWFR